jgi:predicted TIM-barrel fold metal-dependent hydrolase
MLMGHCHLFPGGLGEEKRDEWGVPGTAEHLELFMRSCGFDQAQVLAPHEGPADPSVMARIDGGGLEWLLAQSHVGVSRDAPLQATATIRPDHPGALDKLRAALSAGVRILKVHALIMRCDTLHPSCEPFWRAAEEAALPVTYHTGAGGWGWETAATRPAACVELARRYPGLSILMAHCGVFGDVDEFAEAVSACEERPNLLLDSTYALLEVSLSRWRDAVTRLGPGRIVYGNDYPWVTRESVQRELERVDILAPRAVDRTLILGGTMRALLERH